MCRHHTQCLPATLPGRDEACLIVHGLRQGGGPLGDGVVLFGDGGELSAKGQSTPAHEPVGSAA
ncbi:DUF5999 family protein [Microbispora hainanensis]|uniref:DUF5999 family protein n=1 Tax=Microbispora hainanensis TaxID=568844 RepID=UPI003CC74E6D